MCPIGFEPMANGLKDGCYTDERNTAVSPKPIVGIFTRCSNLLKIEKDAPIELALR